MSRARSIIRAVLGDKHTQPAHAHALVHAILEHHSPEDAGDMIASVYEIAKEKIGSADTVIHDCAKTFLGTER